MPDITARYSTEVRMYTVRSNTDAAKEWLLRSFINVFEYDGHAIKYIEEDELDVFKAMARKVMLSVECVG